jgi:hypothetical protein
MASVGPDFVSSFNPPASESTSSIWDWCFFIGSVKRKTATQDGIVFSLLLRWKVVQKRRSRFPTGKLLDPHFLALPVNRAVINTQNLGRFRHA